MSLNSRCSTTCCLTFCGRVPQGGLHLVLGRANQRFRTVDGNSSIRAWRADVASIPKTNSWPSASQRSRCSLCVEVGVAPETDRAETCLAAQFDGKVEIPSGLLMAGAVAAAIDHEQRLARIGQGKHQGMIAPLALVIDIFMPSLHSPVSLDHRTVGVNHGLVEEVLELLPPDSQCGETVEEIICKRRMATFIEAAAGSHRPWWDLVRDEHGSIKVGAVVAKQFQGAPGKCLRRSGCRRC